MPLKFTIALLALLSLFNSYSQTLSIIPKPQYEKVLGDSILFTRSQITTIEPTINSEWDTMIGTEGYRLQILSSGIKITANTPTGAYYATASIRQLVDASKSGCIPTCEVTDFPRFAYRGMHLDVCRHFFPVSFIKEYLDYLAYYKINYFHWHLTDDQGWRIEIKTLPKLTSVGAYRLEKDSTRYGGYYTQEQIKEIVSYATARHIMVMPEIEMPGHSTAALAAYPEYGCTGRPLEVPCTWGIKRDIYAPSDSTFRFFEQVLDEVCSLFPSRYLHIGGDEAPKSQWKASKVAQRTIAIQQLKNEEELQHYFMNRVEKYLWSKGKIAIGWGEVTKGGLSDSMVVMSWLSKNAGIKAIKHGNSAIMCSRLSCYFDYPQSVRDPLRAIYMVYLPLAKVYRYDPMPSGLSAAEQALVQGGTGTMWTEYIKTEAEVRHQLMPRLAALSEVLWTNPKVKNYREFKLRVRAVAKTNSDFTNP